MVEKISSMFFLYLCTMLTATEEDKIILHAFRRFSIRRGYWKKWLKNCGFPNSSLIYILPTILKRGESFVYVYEPIRMYRILRHSEVTFSWSRSHENFDFWNDFFLNFEAHIKNILNERAKKNNEKIVSNMSSHHF